MDIMNWDTYIYECIGIEYPRIYMCPNLSFSLTTLTMYRLKIKKLPYGCVLLRTRQK